jgi:hypothetical protein
MGRAALAVLVATALLLFASPVAFAATQEAKLRASDTAEADAFGDAVAVDRNRLLVGAPLERPPGGDDQGAVYLFKRKGSGWAEGVKLTASDAEVGDLFGASVALEGETIVVGAPGVDRGTGAVYVFRRIRSTWTEVVKLMASDGEAGDGLGQVEVDHRRVLAGAPGADFDKGAAYVFVPTRTSWTQGAKLTASDRAFGDMFGASTGLFQSTAILGAPGDNDSEGAAYVFIRRGSNWLPRRKLTSLDGAPGDSFGRSVDLYGERALIGAPLDNPRARVDQGAGYVFRGRGAFWAQRRKLVAPDGAPFDRLGSSVAVFGRTALLGAPFDDVQGKADQGSAYVWRVTRSGWNREPTLRAADGEAGDEFGHAVDLNGDIAAVGSPLVDDFLGAVYVFDL